jgi:hypothetical protein
MFSQLFGIFKQFFFQLVVFFLGYALFRVPAIGQVSTIPFSQRTSISGEVPTRQ